MKRKVVLVKKPYDEIIMENKIKNQKEYPGAAEDTYSKATA